MATYLAGRGDEVHLVAHRVADDLRARPNVVVHRVPKPLNSYLLGEPLLDRFGRVVARRIARDGGRVIVNGGNCLWGDVNWVHYVHAAWHPLASGSLARRFKAVVTHRRALAQERAALRRARLVIANSERTRIELIDRLGVRPERVRTIYLGVDAERFRPASPAERTEARARLGWSADDRPVLAFVGALGDLRKGFDVLFDAWRRLSADPDWDGRLVVVGAGAALPHWQGRAAEAGWLDRSVQFLGFRADVPEILRACDVLVSPTRYEAYGLNVQEALCSGLPALVSASAGIAERYPPELDWLRLPDAENAADLAARLRRWRERFASPLAGVGVVFRELRAYTWEETAARFVAAMEPDHDTPAAVAGSS